MALQLWGAFGVCCINAGVKQATPRAWEGNQNCDIRDALDDVGDLSIAALGSEVISLSNIYDIT